MNTMTAKSTVLTASIGLALTAAVSATSVGAADRVSILEDAILDYTGQVPSTVTSSGGDNNIKIVLDESEYDYAVRDLEGYEEEAEFAAFEVVDEPDDLQVWD